MSRSNIITIIFSLVIVISISYIVTSVYKQNNLMSVNEKEIVSLVLVEECELSISECFLSSTTKTIILSLNGKLKTMQQFTLRAKFNNTNDIENVSAKFAMTSMDMGFNQYKFTRDKQHWKATVILPICTNKRSDWEMIFKVETKDKIYKHNFLMQIE